MPSDAVYIAKSTPASTSVTMEIIEAASTSKKTTLTADPGTGTTWALTSAALLPTTDGYQLRCENEVVTVTAGAGTTSQTVIRGEDGTTNVAHPIGATVALVVGIQPVYPVDASKLVSFKGRAATFRTTGRAGTTGQKLLSIHNSATSPVIVDVRRIKVDVVNTAVRAIAVEPVLVRIWKVTVLPTNGTSLAKTPLDSALTSHAAVTVLGDASADKTLSGTALTATLPTGTFVSQEYGPRNFTAVGQEASDKVTFLESDDDVVTLRAGEGLVVHLDYNTATFNPATDFWVATCDWIEYTAA